MINLSPVSTTPPITKNLSQRLIVCVVDTNDKSFSGIVDTADSLSPVSLTLLINIHSWLSPRIFEKSRNDPNGMLKGPGDTDSWKKKLKPKISCQTPFKFTECFSKFTERFSKFTECLSKFTERFSKSISSPTWWASKRQTRMGSTGHRMRELKSRTQVHASFMCLWSIPDKIALYVYVAPGLKV